MSAHNLTDMQAAALRAIAGSPVPLTTREVAGRVPRCIPALPHLQGHGLIEDVGSHRSEWQVTEFGREIAALAGAAP